MLDLPQAIIQGLRPFERVFSERVWEWAKVLLVGAILAPGKRTVTSALRVMGLSEEAQYQNYHRVLNRARLEGNRSSYGLSCILLRLLIEAFVPAGATLVLGLDDHIERRRGEKIAAKGIYRDGVRSSKSFFVKTSGLRWVSMMVLARIPWAARVWALPFLTVLAPSERYHQERGMQHKKITDWARQMIRQVRRWLPGRQLVVVMDSSYAVLSLLATCLRQPVTVVTRLPSRPCPARSLFAGDALCSSCAAWSTLTRAPSRLVSQTTPHLCRCPGPRPSAALARFHFLSVTCDTRHALNS
jgi:hypothetical protein